MTVMLATASRRLTFCWFRALSISLLTASSSVAAGSGGLPAQCWTPAALASDPAERVIQKLHGEPDTKPVKRTLTPFEPVPAKRMGSIRSVKIEDGRKLIALTFDLCEANGQITGYDGAIVDTLRLNGAKATFFAGGKWMLDHTERAEQLIADPLFQIGNHSWSHANVRRVEMPGTLREIRRTQAAYEQVREQLTQKQCFAGQPEVVSSIPARLALYRFPYGACNAEALQAVAEQGLLDIQWDIAMADPAAVQTADMIVQEVLAKVHPGAIIIGHANGRGVHTNEALQTLIPALRKKGYAFVTVGELLAAGKPVIAEECFNEKPGDLDKYDKPAESKANPNPISVSDPSLGPNPNPDPKPRPRRKAPVASPAGNDWLSTIFLGKG